MLDPGTLRSGWNGNAPALRAALVAGMALGFGGTAARAAIIVETLPVLGRAGTFGDFGVDVFVPRFDPALGTLTGVSARMTGTMTPALAFLDLYPTPVASPVLFSPRVALRSPASVEVFLPANSAPITMDAGHQYAIGVPEAVDLTVPLAPLDFTGSGTVDTYWTGHSGPSSPSGPPYGSYGVEDFASLSGQLTVTYTYAAAAAPAGVPEPASFALFGSGLVGLLALRRRPG